MACLNLQESICTEIVAKNKLKTRKVTLHNSKMHHLVWVIRAAQGVILGWQAAAKRYKITGSGKVMARRPGKQHLNEKYSSSQKNGMSREIAVSRSVVKRNVMGAMPYAKIVKSRNPKCMERDVNKKVASVEPKWEAKADSE